MRLRVIAQEPARLRRWVAQQKVPAAKPASGPAAEGVAIFTGNGGCVSCHTVVGIEGAAGPGRAPTSPISSRGSMFAGATIENTPRT